MVSSELCFMTATELTRRIRHKEISCREVMDAHLARIERVNPNVNAIAWYDSMNTKRNNDPQPVGLKWPNEWGLYDMLGNVMELCLDGKRTYTPDSVTDPLGPTRLSADRAARGGSYYHSAPYVRASDRQWMSPDQRDFLAGFRCAIRSTP